MRTPGEDEELAVGFLAGEGLIGGPDDVVSVGPTDDLAGDVVEVRTRARPRAATRAAERSFYLTSSCGVCGKAALEFVAPAAPPPPRGRAADRRRGGARAARPHARARQAAVRAHRRAARDRAVRRRRGDPGRSARTSGATTRWTRRSARCCWPGAPRCPACSPASAGASSFELVQKARSPAWPASSRSARPSTLAVDLARERGHAAVRLRPRRVVQRLLRITVSEVAQTRG